MKELLDFNQREAERNIAYNEAEERYANVHSQNAFMEGYMYCIDTKFSSMSLQEAIDKSIELIGNAVEQAIKNGAELTPESNGVVLNSIYFDKAGVTKLCITNRMFQRRLSQLRKADLEWEWNYHQQRLKEVDEALGTERDIEIEQS